MKKVIIAGGGISGLTAGIVLQKSGFETHIYEKNPIAGGELTGWRRDGIYIDNCIDWLTNSKADDSEMYALWKDIGMLGDNVKLCPKNYFFSYTADGRPSHSGVILKERERRCSKYLPKIRKTLTSSAIP